MEYHICTVCYQKVGGYACKNMSTCDIRKSLHRRNEKKTYRCWKNDYKIILQIIIDFPMILFKWTIVCVLNNLRSPTPTLSPIKLLGYDKRSEIFWFLKCLPQDRISLFTALCIWYKVNATSTIQSRLVKYVCVQFSSHKYPLLAHYYYCST